MANDEKTVFPPVLCEGRQWLVIDKPVGLAVHPGPRTPHSLEQILVAHAARHEILQPAHRLDRDTSGCLVIARRRSALRHLSQAFQNHDVGKTYLAIVENPPAAGHGQISAALTKYSTREQGWRMRADPAGQPAVTLWQVVERKNGLALVRFQPKTGRTHQLRVHATLLNEGAAIMGDPVYGRPHKLGMMLHATTLDFPDPDGGPDSDGGKSRILAHAPLPGRFAAAGFAEPSPAG